MTRTFRTVSRAVIAAGVLALALSGCSTDSNAVKLADTKGPSQLLRNSIADRIPAEMIDSQGQTSDVSEGCGDDGVRRSWRSSVLFFITPASADQVTQLLSDLGDSLSADQWAGTETSASDNIHELRLTSPRTSSVIRLTATGASDDDGNGATMQIAVNGPCVVTDGPDSDEVKHLEGRD